MKYDFERGNLVNVPFDESCETVKEVRRLLALAVASGDRNDLVRVMGNWDENGSVDVGVPIEDLPKCRAATLTPSSALAAGTTYTVTVASTVTDTSGNALGTTASWTFTTATIASPLSVQLSPNTGSGSSVTLSLSVTDSGGYANITQAALFIGTAVGATNSCYIAFESPNNLYLRSDANTSWSSATVGSATVLQNSQCSINANLVTVSSAGNTLTVTLPVTFLINPSGAWTLFTFAADKTGKLTGWLNSGTWVP